MRTPVATLTLKLLMLLLTPGAVVSAAEFGSDWSRTGDRAWVGRHYWANRLQDWRLAGGRLECAESRKRYPLRTVHLLTHYLERRDGDFTLRVRSGRIDDATPTGAGVCADASTGFLIGAGSGTMDYRAAAIVHHSGGPGGGYLAGIDATGRLFITDQEQRRSRPGSVLPADDPVGDVLLELTGSLDADGAYRLRLARLDPESGEKLDETTATAPADRMAGNVALFSHPGTGRDTARHWFRDWTVAGSKVEAKPARAAGPVLATQYTLSRGVLKLTAQLMPVGESDPATAKLETRADTGWGEVAEAPVVVPGWTATFRVENWDFRKDTPYRIVYDGSARAGIIRRDPADKPVIVIAGFTGNHNNRRGVEGGFYDWTTGMWFPHADLTVQVAKHQPHVLFFSGDQIYEGASPTHPDREKIELDYLYKWYLWCWAYRHLTADIPCVTIPDDHDVYQGNLWGESGRKTDKDDKGGYVWPAEFVKMVERTQTSHLPDPYDPTPIEQGIGVYYTSMVYGRISFAILEDRKFKSGCNGRVPPSGSNRADHITNPDFDVRDADVPGLKLLGDRQLKFLADWAADWRGADMKMALSQTMFANMATHHGGNLKYLIADLDSNGWPQSGRARALRELRRGFAFHLGGDQHLATVVHHGIDDWEDAGWSFCVPSIANFYPRAWRPKKPGENRPDGAPPFTGRHLDGLKNRVTVYAATNPGKATGHEPKDLHDGMPGYGIVRLDRSKRTITMECWPRFADPDAPDARQYAGWPKTISQLDNYGREAAAYLPEIRVSGLSDPVVQVLDETNGENVYTLRIRGQRFRPKVFHPGSYTVRVGEPGTPKMKIFQGIEAISPDERASFDVRF